jgi:hypothetical protein
VSEPFTPDAEYEKRSEWLIETLIARDFDVPEFHALQTEIAARWRFDRMRRAGLVEISRESGDFPLEIKPAVK